MNPAVTANMLSNALAIGAITGYCVFVYRQRSRSRLESTLLFLLLLFDVGMIVRTIQWRIETPRLGPAISFSIAACMPPAFLLYSECILRRHAPRWVKTHVMASAAVFLVSALTGVLPHRSGAVYVFLLSLVAFMAIMSWIFLARDRSSLSPAENVIADSTLVTLWVTVPLYLTDFRQFEFITQQKFGSIGAMLFVYTAIRFQSHRDRKRTILREVLLAALQATAGAACVFLVAGSDDLRLFLRLFQLALSFVLVYLVVSRIRVLDLKTRDASFLKWLAKADTASMRTFVESLKRLRSGEEFRLIEGPALDGYDSDRLLAFFESTGTSSVRLSQLREILSPASRKGSTDIYAAEQLLDILARDGMNYACVLRKRPLVLFLIHVPQAGQEELTELQIGVIRKLGLLVPEDSHA